MTTHATGKYVVKTWDEQPYDEIADAPKLSRASTTQTFHGDIEGESSTVSLMAYGTEKSASFVQLTRVIGRIGKKQGSFVLQSTGTWDGATSSGTWHVVPDSGPGQLSGLHGEGGWTARGEDYPDVQVTLDYDFKSS